MTMNENNMEMSMALIKCERERQDQLKREGRFKHTLDEHAIQEPEKVACLIEEVGEISRNVLGRAYLVRDGDTSDAALLTELTQLAALSLAWMESLVDVVDIGTGEGRR